MAEPEEKEKKRNIKALNERYTSRITVCKQGQIASEKGDVKNMIRYYNQYLKILADVKDVEDVAQLTPVYFDKTKQLDLAEMFQISLIYWDLCKLYDLTPHLETEFKKSLKQFVAFTYGLKYQTVNAEMLRKFIQKGRLKHKSEFQAAYRKIYMGNKKCFIASFALGPNHKSTEIFRGFRDAHSHKKFFLSICNLYYIYSPDFVLYLEGRNKYIRYVTKKIISVPLIFLSKILRYFI